jgi:hypothetical protein
MMATKVDSRQRWAVPIVSVLLGALLLAVAAVGGQLYAGIGGAGIMLAYAAVLVLFGRRSESVALLGGDVSDERRVALTIKATVFTAYVLIVVILGAWLWEVGHGRDGSPYGELSAIGGLSFLAATIVLGRRG